MLKDLAGSFTLGSSVDVEVRSFSGVRIEKLFPLIAESLENTHVVVLHVGTNNVGEEPLTRIVRFRALISRILDVHASILHPMHPYCGVCNSAETDEFSQVPVGADCSGIGDIQRGC